MVMLVGLARLTAQQIEKVSRSFYVIVQVLTQPFELAELRCQRFCVFVVARREARGPLLQLQRRRLGLHESRAALAELRALRGHPLHGDVGTLARKLIFEGAAGRLECRPVALCLLYTSPSPRDRTRSRMPSSA